MFLWDWNVEVILFLSLLELDWPLELNFYLVWVDVFDTLQGRPLLFWFDIPLAEIRNKWLFLSMFAD